MNLIPAQSFLLSRWVPTSKTRITRVANSNPDYIDPIEVLRTPNFGDPTHSYWGASAYERTYGFAPKIAPGVYEVILGKPLGIVFEENEPMMSRGVRVAELVEGGNAEKSGLVSVGDKLVAVTGVKVAGAKHERQLVAVQDCDFDTIMGAIGSNIEKWRCENVILHLKSP